MSDIGKFTDGLARVKELVHIGSAPSEQGRSTNVAKEEPTSSSFLPSLSDCLKNPKLLLGGLGVVATLYFAYKLWPSRTEDLKPPKHGRSRRSVSMASRASRSSSRAAFPCSPMPEYIYDSTSEDEEVEPPAFRNGFSTDPNYTPNSPFKKYKTTGRVNTMLKSKDSQFYALFNYVGKEQQGEPGAADVITVPSTSSAAEPVGFPGGGSSDQPGMAPPSNVMRELPQNMSQPPAADEAPPQYKYNHQSTLERLKERYQNGELPPALMKQTSVQNSFHMIQARFASPKKGTSSSSAQDQNQMPFLASVAPAPSAGQEPGAEVLDIG